MAHPGRTGSVSIGSQIIGYVFEGHPSIRSAFGIVHRTAAAVIDWSVVRAAAPLVTIFTPLPAFPPISYDETIPLPVSRTYAQLAAEVRGVSPLLETVTVANLYERGTDRRLTLRFVYRAPDRTLTEAEVEPIHAKVIAKMKAGT